MRSFVALSFALALTILLARDAAGQAGSGSVTVGGQVSRAVFLNVAPSAPLSADNFRVTHTQANAHTVQLSISISGGEAGLVRIPLQLRSNAGFKLSASAELSEASLSVMRVTGARGTGRLVAADAVNAATQDAATDGAHASPDAQGFSSTHTLLTGPRISLAGTHDTPSNALEVTLLLEVRPQDGRQHASVELTITASTDIQ
ncbi:MAG TPA: hypothetical protein VJ715_16665 [Pyrinomonadaceae bacterium]|nr:hypothetical protein [Pyrinomonadaceae bacterium]